jgi:Tol biopolymer transport system component
MTDRDVQRILRGISGGAKPRPGFKQELGELLAAELEEEEPDAKGILGLIDGPVAPRQGFKAELGAMLAAQLEEGKRPVAPAGSAARSRGRLGGVVMSRLKTGWWMQSAAAVIVLAMVASGFAWNSCLQTIGPPATEVAGPAAPGEVDAPVEVPPAAPRGEEGPSDGSGTASGTGGQPREEGAPTGGPAPSGDVPAPPVEAPEPVPPSDTEPGDEPPSSVTRPGPSAQSPAILAFASKSSDGYWHIFTMNEDGTDRTQITHGPYHDREPEWSPDGTKIAFMRLERVEDHFEDSRIYIVNADGSGLRFLIDGAEPVWSPDGSRLVYTGPSEIPVPRAATIWIIDADGSDARPVGAPGSSAEPSWSPRGGLISFAAVLAGPEEATSQVTNVYSIHPDGSGFRRLTNNPYACNTSFSPDGRRIAYVAFTESPFDVWTMNADGSDKKQLTSGTPFDFYPHWSPNGKRIAFGRDPDGDPHWTVVAPEAAGPEPSAIWVMKADGSDQHRISPPGVNDADPAFRPKPRRRT